MASYFRDAEQGRDDCELCGRQADTRCYVCGQPVCGLCSRYDGSSQHDEICEVCDARTEEDELQEVA